MGDLGLFGLTAPEEYGGAGGDFTSLCVAIEELGRVDQSMGITLEAAVGLGINADPGVRDRRSRSSAGCPTSWPAAPLPASGSPSRGRVRTPAGCAPGPSCRTAAWVVNGAKQFITNAGSDLTSVVTVAARTGVRADGRPEISSIVVPVGHVRASSPRRHTTSSAGTPPTPTR